MTKVISRRSERVFIGAHVEPRIATMLRDLAVLRKQSQAAVLRDLVNEAAERAARAVTEPPTETIKPDWTTAPDWARYWAVDPSGECFWFAELPKMYSGGGFAGWNSPNGQSRLAGTVFLPLGEDWRKTLTPCPMGMRV